MWVREVVIRYKPGKRWPSALKAQEDLAAYAHKALELEDGDPSRETAIAIVLDTRLRPLCFESYGGGASSAVVDCMSILRAVLMAGGTALALAHVHPSGDVTPSDDDRRMTRQVQLGCDAVGVRFIDHVVVTAGGLWASAYSARSGTL